jgi:hypothetical protein
MSRTTDQHVPAGESDARRDDLATTDDEELVRRELDGRRQAEATRQLAVLEEAAAQLARQRRNTRRVLGAILVLTVAVLGLSGWQLLRNHRVDGSEKDFSAGDVELSTAIFLALLLLFGVLVVWQFRRGRGFRSGATWVGVGLLVVAVVVAFAGEMFTAVQADRCDCSVSQRTGVAEAAWLGFDTIPLLKINDTLGWTEPQPIEAVRPEGSDAADTPAARWLPALAIRFAVGILLLALVKGAWDALFRPPVGAHGESRPPIAAPTTAPRAAPPR